MDADVRTLFDRLLPWALEALLDRALSGRLPRSGPGGQFAIAAVGRFSGRLVGDVLAHVGNQGIDGALVFAEEDVVRTLFLRGGRVVGADSDVLFERMGRILGQAEILPPAEAAALVEREEQGGLAAAVARLGHATARHAIDLRARAIASALFLMPHAHYVLVEGRPDLGDLPELDLSPMELAVDGLRRYDEWRGRQGTASDRAHPPPAPVPALRVARRPLRSPGARGS